MNDALAADPYSPFKVVHHPDRLEQLRSGLQPAPLQVHMVLSNRCNQRCSFCAYRRKGSTSSELFRPAGPGGRQGSRRSLEISLHKCEEILSDCVRMGIKAVQFTGGGEPLIHRDHAKVFVMAKELGLDIALVTNGTLVTGATLEALRGAAWVRVSLDAASAETYAKVRGVRPELFQKALGAIRDLATLRDREKWQTIVGVGFVVIRENRHEIRDAVRLCRELGADNVRISGAFMPKGFAYHAPFFQEAKDQLAEAKRDFEARGFRIFDLYDDRLCDLKEGSPSDPFCGYMHLVTYIGADLNVYRCCVLAYSRAGLVGSIAERSFRELWESPEKQADFECFDARLCPRCMFNNKNRFMRYCISRNPLHVNFV